MLAIKLPYGVNCDLQFKKLIELQELRSSSLLNKCFFFYFIDMKNIWINRVFTTLYLRKPKFQMNNSSISEILSSHFKKRIKKPPL